MSCIVSSHEIKNSTNICHHIHFVYMCGLEQRIHKFTYQRKYNFPSNQDNLYPRIFNVFTVIDASELNNYKSK